MVLLGLGLANGLTGLSGALFAQLMGAADISMGVGIIVIGLAAVIGGTALLPSRLIPVATLACILGSILYHLAIGLALSMGSIGVTASDVNIVTAILVTLAATGHASMSPARSATDLTPCGETRGHGHPRQTEPGQTPRNGPCV